MIIIPSISGSRRSSFTQKPPVLGPSEDAIIARAATSRRAAVIGGGLLGLEAAKVPEGKQRWGAGPAKSREASHG